jgi:hypothetical protein
MIIKFGTTKSINKQLQAQIYARTTPNYILKNIHYYLLFKPIATKVDSSLAHAHAQASLIQLDNVLVLLDEPF